MCTRLAFVALVAALSLGACLDLESRWRWNGISVEDEAGIRAALHKITSSPIVALQPRDPDVPNSLGMGAPNEIVFYTKDDKIYSAKKVHGKWLIKDITNAIVY